MTTNQAFTPAATTTVRVARRPLRQQPIARVLRDIGRFYRVNWQRAAAQEYEYTRLRDEAIRKYSAATGGRL